MKLAAIGPGKVFKVLQKIGDLWNHATLFTDILSDTLYKSEFSY